jgi:hypothetical protein
MSPIRAIRRLACTLTGLAGGAAGEHIHHLAVHSCDDGTTYALPAQQ